MKKKGLLILGAVGFIAVVLFFAGNRLSQDQKLTTVTGGGLGGYTVQGGYNTRLVPTTQAPTSKGGSSVPWREPGHYSGPTTVQSRWLLKENLKTINRELRVIEKKLKRKMTPEHKIELEQRKEKLEQAKKNDAKRLEKVEQRFQELSKMS